MEYIPVENEFFSNTAYMTQIFIFKRLSLNSEF